jgi:hypothetical protein
LGLFKVIQQIKLKETEEILKIIWIRGIYLILDHGFYLQRKKNEYKNGFTNKEKML